MRDSIQGNQRGNEKISQMCIFAMNPQDAICMVSSHQSLPALLYVFEFQRSAQLLSRGRITLHTLVLVVL
jgi:hypothetical protein